MNITRKELETKAVKTFRKANRLKTTALKLEKLHEFLEILWKVKITDSDAQKPFDQNLPSDTANLSNLIQSYIDLCFIQKLKFQLDALFEGIQTEMKHLAQVPEQLTQAQFDWLLQRLYMVMEIDSQYPEADRLFNMLLQEYPQFADHSVVGEIALDLSPYQRPNLVIEMTCRLTDLSQNSRLESLYKKYQHTVSEKASSSPDQPADTLASLRFTQQQLSEFAVFHEELRTKSGYSIGVNTHPVEERIFSEWFQCYQRFLKAKTPQYCYGASPLTFNVFGCHKLHKPDVAKCLEQCWFHDGAFDKHSSLFLLDLSAIVAHLRAHLSHCGFCPAFTQEKLLVGLGVTSLVYQS